MALDNLINEGNSRDIKCAMSTKMFLSGSNRDMMSHALNVDVDFFTQWNRVCRAEGLLLGYIGSEGYLSDEEQGSIHH